MASSGRFRFTPELRSWSWKESSSRECELWRFAQRPPRTWLLGLALAAGGQHANVPVWDRIFLTISHSLTYFCRRIPFAVPQVRPGGRIRTISHVLRRGRRARVSLLLCGGLQPFATERTASAYAAATHRSPSKTAIYHSAGWIGAGPGSLLSAALPLGAACLGAGCGLSLERSQSSASSASPALALSCSTR